MEWRVIAAGLVMSIGLALGWMEFGTLGGGVVFAALGLGCLAASVLIDKLVHGL